MQKIRNQAARLIADTQADLAQYALILVLVAIVAITVLEALGVDITAAFQSVVDAI